MPQPKMPRKAQAAYSEALRSIETCRKRRKRRLELDALGLTSVPPEIGRLTALTHLDLSGNQLTSLPAEIGRLSALTELSLHENRFTSLPASVFELTALTELFLGDNQLARVPKEIGQLTGLRELYVFNNQLTALPREIQNLSALKVLNVSSNKLADVPEEIAELRLLTNLHVRENRFTNLPAAIARLPALTQLDLSDNQLTSFPMEVRHLTALTTLALSGNRLTSVPAAIGKLKTLQRLHLSDNQLISLPAEIGQLTALTMLNLSGNHLTSLPAEIGQLTALTALYLYGNQLTSLPAEIGHLSALTELYLHGNPALGLPAEVLGPDWLKVGPENPPAKPAAIVDYYFSRRQEGSKPLNEVKLLLVGRGEAGKTSISRALRGEPFDQAQKETPGIEIQPWEAPCPDGKVRIHLWDFAGQEITHETHRFFLSQRSLYVVVLDGRGGQQMEEAEYWLSHVAKYGTAKAAGLDGRDELSPVIVALNKWKSPGPYDVEKRRLQREYPNIRAFVETDCEDGAGIEKLKKTIFAALKEMPAVRAQWALSYFKVRNELEKLSAPKNPKKRKHFLTWNDYRTVCERCGVKDERRQAALAENLNALGIALYYGEDERLRDTRVLNPNWAANGLYGLLRGVQRRPHRGQSGVLWAGDFAEVLAEGMKGMNPARGAAIEDYPENRDGVKVHEFLLNLMQDRELGFLAGEEKGRSLYLLPGLLALDEPEPENYDVAAHIEAAELRFRYLYELLPAGVMSRFIVRTHVLSDYLHRWQRGVVLGWGDARALVMAERRRNPRVDVYIRDGTREERQELAGVVRSNMQEIHSGLPEGLRGVEELELTLPGEHYESVEKLERLEAANQPLQIVTEGGAREENVEPQLEQVQPAKARRKGAPKLKVFVSYAHANYKAWNHLKTHLDVLKNEGLVSWWFDGKIRAGAEWDNVIRRELNEANIVVLVLSNAFFASRYIKGVELKAARKLREAGEVEILPLLLEPSEALSTHKVLKGLQAVPIVHGRLRALTSFNPSVNGWNLVQKALREIIAGVAAKRPKFSDRHS